MLSKLKIWLKAIRVPFLTATIIPVTLGAILAWYDEGYFLWMRFWLALLGALLIHIGTNLANDYFDHLSGCDETNPTPTPFSGGSRVIQEGLVIPRKILSVALISFTLGFSHRSIPELFVWWQCDSYFRHNRSIFRIFLYCQAI